MSGRLLEVCCDSLASALAAERGGAQRIELCACLECDGLTPDARLLGDVMQAVRIPVFVMIRPRAGDFAYSREEMEGMLGAISRVMEHGASGIVSGCLEEGGGTIDLGVTERLVKASGSLPFTFHRAFDSISDPEQGLKQLVDLGAVRVLTSGGGARADGERLAHYQRLAGHPLQILSCGGIRKENIGEIAAIPELTEFHSAALASGDEKVVDENEVAGMVAAIV